MQLNRLRPEVTNVLLLYIEIKLRAKLDLKLGRMRPTTKPNYISKLQKEFFIFDKK